MKEKLGEILELIVSPIYSIKGVDISIYSFVKIAFLLLILQLILFLIKKFIKYQIKSRGLHHGDVMSIYQIIKYLLIGIIVIMIMSSLGINTTILWTSSAALMVGVGFGLQNIFKDILSGVLILFGKVIRVGDIVEVGDVLGKVLDINLRTSRVITRDDVNMIVPNSKFIEENVINWTLDFTRVRIDLKIGVAYGSDVEKVKEILLKAASESDKILPSPKPTVNFADFGDSSLDFKLLFWTKEVFRKEFVLSDLRFKIDQEFRKENITIPFPQRTVWNM